jgi:hypothetical protein
MFPRNLGVQDFLKISSFQDFALAVFSQFLKDLVYLPSIADCLSLGITAEIDQKSTRSGCPYLSSFLNSLRI